MEEMRFVKDTGLSCEVSALSHMSKNLDSSKEMGLLNKQERLVFSSPRVSPMRAFQ